MMSGYERLQSDGLKYMKKKYGKEVEFSIKSAGSGAGSYDMYLTPTGKEDWEVFLSWFQASKAYEDNYTSWVLRDQVEQVFSPVFEQVYGECVAFNSPYGGQMSDRYTKYTTVEEYLETAIASAFYVFTTSDQENREQDLNVLLEKLQEKNLRIDITVVYVEREQLKEISRENYKQEFIEKENFLCCGGMRIKQSGLVSVYGWEEGENDE